ncbi:11983_t:CDS:1, partial [Dentiscutata heterogama]
MVSDLDDEIRVRGLILIQKFKEKIYNEKDYNQVLKYIDALKNVDNFFIKDEKNYINELE